MVPCDLKLGVERETVLLMRLVRLQGLFTAVFPSPLAERRQKQFSAFLKTCSVCRRETSLCSFAKKTLTNLGRFSLLKAVSGEVPLRLRESWGSGVSRMEAGNCGPAFQQPGSRPVSRLDHRTHTLLDLAN